MLTWNQLHESLARAGKRHQQLETAFGQFGKYVVEQAGAKDFHIKGVNATLDEAQRTLTVTFASRTLLFAFSSAQGDSGALTGKVDVYLAKKLPKEEFDRIGGFVFDGNGQSDIVDPEEKDRLHINYDVAALYIALHFVQESLAK
jgi:hypothetical protein